SLSVSKSIIRVREFFAGCFGQCVGLGSMSSVNAALNIIRKVSGNSPFEGRSNRLEVFAVSPVRVNPVRKKTQKVR
ncbi:MAG: hypothetical protein WCD53_27380, partial [Microcoleus sp.]